MAYNSDPASTHNPATGVVVPTVWLDLINANFNEIGKPWTSYTPTWSASGAAPALGNGALAGAYKQIGTTLFLRIRWIAGSTTTFGTGSYRFLLPAAEPSGVPQIGIGVEQSLSAKGYDASAATNYVLTAFVVPSSGYVELISNAAGGVGDTSPVTWADGDGITITGAIEVAFY